MNIGMKRFTATGLLVGILVGSIALDHPKEVGQKLDSGAEIADHGIKAAGRTFHSTATAVGFNATPTTEPTGNGKCDGCP